MLAVDWNWSLILDYIRVLIWPLLVAGIVAFLLFRYHVNVGRLIDRTKSLKWPGGGSEHYPSQQQDDADAVEAAEAAEEAVEHYNGLVDTLVEAYADLHQATANQEALTRELVVKNLQLDFERIYRVIYGSQIEALRTLRAFPAGVVGESTLRQHFERSEAVAQSMAVGAPRRNFNDWLNYLIAQEMVSPQEDGTYLITPKGSAFLDYIDAGGYPTKMF